MEFFRQNPLVHRMFPINSLAIVSMVESIKIKREGKGVFSVIVESSIPDVAIEHRRYIYNQDQTSSITCRGATELQPIQPLEIDQGCRAGFSWDLISVVSRLGKRWSKNALKYFTFPINFTRNQSLSFCSNNNGTLMYWSDLIEQGAFQSSFSSSFISLIHSVQIFFRRLSTISFDIKEKLIHL